tara:strand:+ start:13468 stop:14526 length:1059 start_codon:yes stop_codon:yes gene_type:complete
MSKSVFQTFDVNALTLFGLDTTPLVGVVSNSDLEVADILLTDSETTYSNIRRKLTDNEVTTIGSGTYKKAFLYPKCPVSLTRVKEALKEHGIRLVNSIEDADLFITHDNYFRSFESGETIHSTCMMYRLWNYDLILSTNAGGRGIASIENHSIPVLFDGKLDEYANSHQCYLDESGLSAYDAWGITGMAVNIAYKIITEGVKTIDVETVLYESANKQTLTEQLISDIGKYVESYNKEDLDMVAKILPTIDYTKELHLFWKLARDIDHKLYNFNSNKDVQYWIEASKLNKFSYMDAEDLVLYLEENDLLNSKYFRFLEPIVRREIQIHNRNLYVFKVQVKPEYRKFLKNSNDE